VRTRRVLFRAAFCARFSSTLLVTCVTSWASFTGSRSWDREDERVEGALDVAALRLEEDLSAVERLLLLYELEDDEHGAWLEPAEVFEVYDSAKL